MSGSAFGGLTVLEYADFISGPYCGKLLADLGAKIIKIEPPGKGDSSRRFGPFRQGTPDPEASGLFLYLNTNKSGVTLDLRSDEGRAIFYDLVGRADVLIENHSPRAMTAKRLGYRSLKSINPSLIYTAITPFGVAGPGRYWKGNNLTAFHSGGMASFTPDWVEDPEKMPPLQAGGFQADFAAGIVAAMATLAALYGRALGQGCLVDISEQEVVAFALARSIAFYTYEGVRQDRRKQARSMESPVPCRDGYVECHIVEESHWQAFREVIGHPEWSASPLFETYTSRCRNWKLLAEDLKPWTMRHDKQEIYRMMQARRVAFGPVNTAGDVLKSPQIAERGYFVGIDHPRAGRLQYPGPPFRLTGSSEREPEPAPLLGQDNAGVYGEMTGFSGSGSEGPILVPKNKPGPLPLSGIRIVDFTWWQAGPQATLFLASLGAEVIKVESRRRPDIMRRTSVHFHEGDPESLNYSAHFYSLNYNKKSLALDLTRPEGIAVARELAAVSDVVTENFAGGVMDRLGLRYADLKAVNPRIIMLSTTGMGQTGPESRYLSYAQTMHALTGLSSVTGYPGGPPNSVGAYWGDHISACTGAFAVLAALHHRRHTGEGQYIDLSMSEAVMSTIPEVFMAYVMSGEIKKPAGNRSEVMAPHGCYRCQGDDAWVAIAVTDDREWRALGRALDSPPWTREDRYGTTAGRLANQDELDECLEAWTRQRSPQEVVERLRKAGIACAASNDLAGLIEDPSLTERGFFVRRRRPKGGEGLQVRTPWKMSGYPQPHEAPPALGEHSRYVVCDILGKGEEEFRRLVEEKVIY